MNLVRLRNGREESSAYTFAIMREVKELEKYNPPALFDLITTYKDPEYLEVISDQNKKLLIELSLLTSQGLTNPSVGNVVLSSLCPNSTATEFKFLDPIG